MVLRIAGLANKSTSDGPGVRFTVYAQGCPHRCDGCDIPQAHSFEGGTLCDVEELWETITQSGGIEGITLSGGEPFCQSGPMAELARRAKEKGPFGVDVYGLHVLRSCSIKARAEASWSCSQLPTC